jgi:hypothetical protein
MCNKKDKRQAKMSFPNIYLSEGGDLGCFLVSFYDAKSPGRLDVGGEGGRDFKNSFPSYLTFPPGRNIRAVLITGFTQDCGVKRYKIFPRNFCVFFHMRQIITHIEIENLGDTFRILPVYKPRGRKAGGIQRDVVYLS